MTLSLTQSLTGLIVAFYVLTSFPRFTDINPAWAMWGAYYTGAVLHGEWYRLITANLLHANWLHLLLNVVIILNLGAMVERVLGPWRIGLIYAVSGLACLGVSALVLGETETTLGASGMGFGVVGAYAVMILVITKRYGTPAEFKTQVRAALGTLGLLVFLTVGMNFLGDHYNHAGHLGGFLGGALVTFLMIGRMNPQPAPLAGPSANPLSPESAGPDSPEPPEPEGPG